MMNNNYKHILSLMLVVVLATVVSTPVVGWEHHHGGYHREFGTYYYPLYPPPNYYYIIPPAHRVHPKHVVSAPVMQAQEQLTKLGYYGGKIDGKLGNKTSAAISMFQHDQGLPETGALNQATIHALGLNK